MEGVLERMSSAQILAAIAILVGGVVALAMILSITRYQLRSLEDETELRREQQQGELALRNKMLEHGVANGNTNLDALLTPITPPSDELNSGLAMRFGMLELEPSEIESHLQLAMAAEPGRKQAIIDTMDHLLDNDSEHEAILAAIRPLCPAPEPSVSTEF